jgi:nicotinamidase-related amidase
MCVLFTANDAFMRDYKVYIPRDCVAAVPTADNQDMMEYMERVLEADTRASQDLDLEAMLQSKEAGTPG